MGIFIGLNIVEDKISPLAWQEVYMETLQLLNAYPFMRIKLVTMDGRDLPVYVRDVEAHKDDPAKRHWSVSGDMDSKKTGESFSLSYALKCHDSQGERDTGANIDILVEIIREGKLRLIFNDKTQGYPYHNYILAIAMLIETRLEPYAAVRGNITREQAEKAKEWADAILTRQINIPVRVNKELLYQRLHNHFQGIELISAFHQLWDGPRGATSEFLYSQNAQAYREWFLEQLKGYSSPGMLGAVQLYIDWLNSAGDLTALCKMACLDQNGPRFSPQEFTAALCNTWITIPGEKCEFMDTFLRPQDIPDTIYSLFGNIILDLGFAGRKLNFHQPMGEVLSILNQLFPEQIAELEKTIHDKEQSIESELEVLSELALPAFKQIEDESKEGVLYLEDEDFLLYYQENMKLSDNQSITLEFLALQGKVLLKQFEENEATFKSTGLNEMQILISIVSRLRLVLTEDAWNWIRQEKGHEIIRLLISFSASKPYRNEYRATLKALFENRALCARLLQLTQDQEAMDRAMALIQDHQSEIG